MFQDWCPYPDKQVFLTLRDATRFAFEQLVRHGRLLRPYACEETCGRYHLTSEGLKGSELTEAMVRRLAAELGVMH